MTIPLPKEPKDWCPICGGPNIGMISDRSRWAECLNCDCRFKRYREEAPPRWEKMIEAGEVVLV